LEKSKKRGVLYNMGDPSSPDKALACLNKADYLLEMAATAGYLTERQTARIRENGQELIKMINENKGGQTE
jgi:hypothetical protein